MNVENGFLKFQGNRSNSELFTLPKKCSKLWKIVYCSFRTASKYPCHIYALTLTLNNIVIIHFYIKRKGIGIKYTLNTLLQNATEFITKCDSYFITECTMEVKRLITLGLEIFKTLNNLNHDFMEEIFYRTKWLTHRPNNLQVNVYKTAKYGDKSLRNLGPHIWNSLLEHMKAETNFIKFREYINQRFGPICKCNLCIYINK